MKLSQKLHSVLENKSYLKKSRLFLSLTAIGVLGGFFVALAVLAPSVTNPKTSDVWSGTHNITWTADCEVNSTVDISLAVDKDFYNNIALGVPCASLSYSWNTAEKDGEVAKFADGNNYRIMVYKSGKYGYSDIFAIDNTLPVLAENAITVPIASTTVGGTNTAISWNTSITEPNLADAPISLAYTTDTIEPKNWTTIASGLSNSGSYSWALPTGVLLDSVKIKISALDKAGNVGSQESAAFKIDTVNPTAVITTDSTGVVDANPTKTFTVTYSEAMNTNTSVSPVITFGTGVLSTPVAVGAWSGDNKIWTQTFTFAEKQEVANVNVSVNGGKDLAGNAQAEGSLPNAFSIDTKNPTVATTDGVVASPANAKVGTTVSVSVKFSENMNTTVQPLVQALVEGGTPFVITGAWSTTDATKWVGSITVPTGVTSASVDINVSGAKDAAGNAMSATFTKTDAFQVDTVAPVASGITVDTPKIYDGDLTQKVMVTYGEAMSVAPTITFGSGSFVNDGVGTWDTNNKIWTQSFKTTDSNEEIAGVTVTANIAQDLAGNVQPTAVTSSVFAIDTKNPTVVLSDNHADSIVNNADNVIITAQFSEDVVSPTIKIGNAGAIAMVATAGNASLWTYPWDVPTGNDGLASIIIMTMDIAGNANLPATAGTGGTISYTIDNTPPAVTVDASNTYDTTPTVTGTCEAGTTVSVSVNSIPYVATVTGSTWTITSATLTENTYSVTATATDGAGNTGTATGSLIIDTSKPIITDFTSIAATVVDTDGNVDLSFTATDSYLKSYSYQIDAATAVSTDFPTPVTSPVTTTISLSGLSDGKHTVALTVTDVAGNVSDVDSISFIVNTDHILTVAKSGAEYSSIAAAISAASSGDTIKVTDSETYTEPLIADKPLFFVAMTSATTPVATQPTISAGTTVAADSVSISGFTISNPNGVTGIYSTGTRNNISITNNIFTGIGTSANHGAAVYFQGKVANITVSGNNISNIGNPSASVSSKGVYFGDSDGTEISDNLDIKNNTISNVYSAKGAYGIMINYGAHATGQTTGVEITGNAISGLSGGWSTAIGLEGKTPNAIVGNNIVGILGNASAAISIEDNASANSIQIKGNKFDSSIIGIANKVSGSNVVAGENWWGTNIKSQIKTWGKDATATVAFSPWYLNEGRTKLSDSGILTVDDTGTVADFKTIQAAIDAVASAVTANAQINVAAGTYNENIIIPASLTGLKISGNNKSDTFIKSGTGNVVTMNGPATIEGFTIDGLGTGLYGVYEQNVIGVIVQNNTIKSYNRNGVYADKGNISILNNVIVDDGAQTDFSADAIYTRGGLTATITGNDLSGNIFAQIIGTGGGTSAGISIHAGDKVAATGNTIHGNTIGIHAKTGAIVNATGNKIYSNDVGFLYENENNETVSGTFNAINNWWGTAKKSEIAAKIEKAITTGNVTQTLAPTDVVSFDPWYLNLNQDGSFGNLSSTDTTGPVVVLSTDDADGIVKAETGKTVTITANITDATTGIDGVPKITIADGGVSGVAMTAGTGNNWTYSWTVPASDITATISVEAFDYVGHGVSSTTGTTGLIANTTNLIVDNTAPTLVTNDGTETGPVKTDAIKITITEANEIAESKYGFSTNAICDADDTFDNTFASGTEFSIAGNHADFLCVMAKDAAGNISYLPVGKLNTDNAAPVLKEITPIATPGNITTPTYVFTSSEAGTISYSGGCSSSTATASSGDNTIVFVALNDGVYNNCKIKVTDTATNATELDVSDFVVDTTAPAIGSKSPEARVDNLDPVISAKFSDGLGSGIDKSGVVVTVFSESGLVKFTNQDFKITETGVISNTSKIYLVAGGRYKVTLTGLKDLAGNATADDEWSFSVLSTANPSDNDVPTATSNPANGATNVAINVNPVITFSEPMNKSTLTPGNIKLKTYETPSTEIDATLSISGNDNIVTIKPDSALDNSTKYYIMIESGSVSDIAGNKAVSWTKSSNLHVFTTEAPGGTIVNTSINLVPGWNLISLPLIPTNSAIATVLGATLNTATVVDIVQYYKADTGNWISYKPGETNPTLTTMEDGKGYWIYINGSSGVTLSVSGSVKRAASPTIPGYTMFGKKWNLIGFKSLETKTVSEYIGAMNAEDIMLDGNSNNLTENSNIQKGLGYWYYNSGSSDRVINPNK